KSIVPPSIKGLRRHTTEVSDTRKRQRHQSIKKLIHPPAAERHLRTDGQSLPELESGDGFFGSSDDRLLPGDHSQFCHRTLQELHILNRLTHSDVQYHTLKLGNLHHVLIPKLLHKCRDDLLLIRVSKSRSKLGLLASLVQLRGRIFLRGFSLRRLTGSVFLFLGHYVTYSTVSLDFLLKRTRRPSPKTLIPIRVGFCVTGQKNITLEI